MAKLTSPQAVIFDVYDTLFSNSDNGWHETFNTIVNELELPMESLELWKDWKKYERRFRTVRTNMDDPANSPPFKTYETSWTECFQRVFDDHSTKGDAITAAQLSVKHMARCNPFPETLSALNRIASRVRIAVFSNADDDFLRPLLRQYPLRFEVVASSESAGAYKPNPFAFRHILDLLGLEPDQVWYVGDNPFDDIYGANRVGMTTVWVNRNDQQFTGQIKPDAIVQNLTELVFALDAG